MPAAHDDEPVRDGREDERKDEPEEALATATGVGPLATVTREAGA
ncbi:hypothetical protein [Streptomyces sp. NPDC054765]